MAILLAINTATVWRLFSTEFTAHMNSNEGSFMAISRFLMEHWPHVSWFPYWFNGLPFENTYSPLMPMMDAALAKAFHCSTALAFHFTAALFYALGPALLFLFAWKVSRRLWPSFMAAMFYSLTSPSVLYPLIRLDLGGWFYARRLHSIVHYGEAAHNIVLAVLPLAMLLAWYAITRRKFGWYAALCVLSALMLLTNAFAAVLLALSVACLVAVEAEPGRSLATVAIIGAVAYLLVSPIMTPTLIQIIRTNSQWVDGDFRYTFRTYCWLVAVAAGGIALWLGTRRLASRTERFSWLFLYLFAAITASAYFDANLLPQAKRYHLEMEMGFCLALAFGVIERLRAGKVWVSVLLLLFFARQTVVYRRYAHDLIKRIDISSTVEYQTAKWIDANLPGERSYVMGSTGLWLNLFSDNPQLGSGHRPFLPNPMIEAALYGMGIAPDPHTVIIWLKAFGCRALAFSGPNGRDQYKPMWPADKFKGLLPLLRQDGDDVVYGVPISGSLAHVIPAQAVIAHVPIHGLDTAEVERFVNALTDASLNWLAPDRGRISAKMTPGEVIALQITYDPRWIARIENRRVPITKDGIGLMTIHPECAGICDINITFER